MLPPSLIQYDPDMLLKYFSAKFVEKYDVVGDDLKADTFNMMLEGIPVDVKFDFVW